MSRPWMPLYIADYLADTLHLSAAESGAYLFLIMHYWEHGRLPDNEVALARIARLTPREWAKYGSTLAAFFGDGWTHKRVDDELAKSEDISNKRRSAVQQRKDRRSTNESSIVKQLNTHARVGVTVIEDNTQSLPEEVTPARANLDNIQVLISEAAGEMPCAASSDISPIVRLTEQGWDLDKHVLPGIREMARQQKRAGTWLYVANTLVGKAQDIRAGPPPDAKPEPASVRFARKMGLN